MFHPFAILFLANLSRFANLIPHTVSIVFCSALCIPADSDCLMSFETARYLSSVVRAAVTDTSHCIFVYGEVHL